MKRLYKSLYYLLVIRFFLPIIYSQTDITSTYILNETSSPLYINTSLILNEISDLQYVNTTNISSQIKLPIPLSSTTLINIQVNTPTDFKERFNNATLILDETSPPLRVVNASQVDIEFGNILKITKIFYPANNSYFDESNNTIFFRIEAINSKFINSSFVILSNNKYYLKKDPNNNYIKNTLIPYPYYFWYSTYSSNITFPEFQGSTPICVENFDGITICNYTYLTVNLPPRIKHLCPKNNTYLNISQVNITCWVNDTVPGIKEIRLNITNILTGNSIIFAKTINDKGEYNITFNLNLTDGSYKYYCEAEDLSGKTNETDLHYLTIDTTPPNVTIHSPKNTTYNTSKIWLNYTVTDNFNIFECWYELNGTINETKWLSAPPEFTDWKYRRKIEIYNPNSYDLVDFQVKITFNSSLIYGKAKSDGSDIRLTYLDLVNQNEFEIPFCFETENGECNSTTIIDGISNITIWVKIPFIPANGVATIYMYYSNPNISAPVNYTGKDVFVFYDDFSQDPLSSSCYMYSGSVSYDDTNKVLIIGLGDTDNSNGALEVNLSCFNLSDLPSGIFEMHWNPLGIKGEAEGRIDSIMLKQSDSNYYYLKWSTYSTPYLLLRKTVNGASVSENSTDILLDYTARNDIWRLKWSLSYLEFDDIGIDSPYYKRFFLYMTDYTQLNISTIRIYTWQGKFETSWIRIRRYADQEPSYSIFEEKTIYGEYANVTLNLPDGNYTLTVYAKDFLGNIGYDSVSFKVNTTIYITVISPKDNILYNKTWILVNASLVGPVEEAWFTINDTNYTFTNTSENYYWSYIKLKDGNYSLIVCAKNLDDKIFCSDSIYFSVIGIPEIFYDITPSKLNVSIEYVNISWYAVDNDLNLTWAEIYYPNGTLYLNSTNNVSFIPNEIGNWTVIFYALDSSGNLADETAKFEVVDGISPNITIILPKENETYYNEVSINYTVWDNYKIDMCWMKIYKILPITIYNPNTYDLMDYQLKINLTNISDYLKSVNYQFKLIDQNNNVIPYCFEQPNGECNETRTDIIWVRVDYLPANSNITLYILPEEKNNATSGFDVFDFYDDFNDGILNTSVWAGDISYYTESNGYLQHNSYGSYYNLYTLVDFNYRFILEARARQRTGYGYYWIGIQVLSSDLSTSLPVLIDPENPTSPNGVYFAGTYYSDSAYANQWYIFQINKTDTYTYVGSVSCFGVIDTKSSSVEMVKIGVKANDYADWDWIRVRKYADYEPIVYLPEEFPLINKTILPSCSNITIRLNESGSYLVRVYANDTLGNIGYDDVMFNFEIANVSEPLVIYELKILNEKLQETYNLTPKKIYYIYLNVSNYPTNVTIYLYKYNISQQDNPRDHYTINYSLNNYTGTISFTLDPIAGPGEWNLTTIVCKDDYCTEKTIDFWVEEYINFTIENYNLTFNIVPKNIVTNCTNIYIESNVNISIFLYLNQTYPEFEVTGCIDVCKNLTSAPTALANRAYGIYNETLCLTIYPKTYLPVRKEFKWVINVTKQ